MKNKSTYYKKLIQAIKKADNIYLFRHQRPDPDALGSSFGLKEIIKDNFLNKKIYNIGEEYPFLEKFFPKPNKISKVKTKNSLAIITDTANVDRIDGSFWNDCDYTVKIDHHPVIEKYGDLQIVFPKTVSTCEIVADWAITNKLKISKKAAEYLYLGLLTDSGRFMFPNTTASTLKVASILINCGVNITKIHQKLYNRSLKHGKLQSHIIDNTVISNKVGYILVTNEIMKKLKLKPEEVKLHANDLAGFYEIDIWVLAIQEEEFIKISIRSKPKYTINKIAAKFNGGGHKNAAGAKVKNKTQLIKLIKELKKEVK